VITFENIRTGEKVVFTGEQEATSRNAHMAAYLNASDLSPNAGVRGQDFGWRLAPEVIAEMEKVRQDMEELDKLSRRIGISIDDIRDFHILAYVAEKDFAKDAIKAKQVSANTELEEDYRARVKAATTGVTISNVNNEGDATVTSEEAIKVGQDLEKQNSKAAKETVKAEVVEETIAVEEAPAKGGSDKSAKK
jgi:hypothetical protein